MIFTKTFLILFLWTVRANIPENNIYGVNISGSKYVESAYYNCSFFISGMSGREYWMVVEWDKYAAKFDNYFKALARAYDVKRYFARQGWQINAYPINVKDFPAQTKPYSGRTYTLTDNGVKFYQ